MVSIDIFAGSPLNQLLRTLIAFVFLMMSDLGYYFFTGGVFAGVTFDNKKITWFPLLPYLILWVALATSFGVIEFQVANENPETRDSTVAKDSGFFGVLTGLVVYGIFISFVYYPNGSPLRALMNFCFGIFVCALSCMMTHLIATNSDLYGT